MYFGLMVLMFEVSNSPKVNRFFRENFGFYMTFGGRSAFFFGVGFFACGTAGVGVLAGLLFVFNAIYHFYVVLRNPAIGQHLKDENQARLAGDFQGDDSGFMTKVANMAVEDPNKLAANAKMAGNLAQQNPGLAQAAMGSMGVQASAGFAPASAPAPAPAPVPAQFAPGPTTSSAAPTGFQVDDYDLGDDDGTAI